MEFFRLSGVDHLSVSFPSGYQHSPLLFHQHGLFEHVKKVFSVDSDLDSVVNQQSNFSKRKVWPLGRGLDVEGPFERFGCVSPWRCFLLYFQEGWA